MENLLARVNKPKAPDEGLGFLLDYVCRLARSFPSFTLDFIWDELPMNQGWAYVAWATENDAMNQFGGVKALSPTYMRQESDKLIKQAKDFWENK